MDNVTAKIKSLEKSSVQSTMEYIVLDLETTGLDTKYSSIIEVGALLVKNGRVTDEFSSFVLYKDQLTEDIKRITGITEEELRNAPQLEQVISDLKSFIGKRPVVSHNGFSFDFPMLERDGLKIAEKYDSIEFAFFILPTNVDGHSMNALAEQFGLGNVPHRALADCKLELEAIRRLQVEFNKKEKKKREALKYIAERTGWWWSSLLSGKSSSADMITDLIEEFKPYRKEIPTQEMLALGTKEIDLEEVKKYFVPTSQSGNSETDYSEARPEQCKMAMAITYAFNKHEHAVIEAGTGTGKSKAYLVPSLLFSLKNGIPMIVSTHTKALQDQLFFKEIPHIRGTIHPKLRVAVLKGKKNYVCAEKFQEFANDVEIELSQRSLYEFGNMGTRYSTRLAYLFLCAWIAETERGDWDELPYWIKERIPKRVESEVCNLDELCGNGTCELYDAQKCFLAKARSRARDADLVIINHALALSGIIIEDNEENTAEPVEESPEARGKVLGHTVFPGEAKFIVFDEAHHLEDDATSAWEHTISQGLLRILLQQLYGKRSAKNLVTSIAQSKNTEKLLAMANEFTKKEGDIKIIVQSLFDNLLPQLVAEDKSGEFSSYCMFQDIPDGAGIKKDFIDTIKYLRTHLVNAEKLLMSFEDETDSPRVKKILGIRAKAVQRIVHSLDIVVGTGEEYVRYLERANEEIQIKAAPLSVAKLLKEYVYDNFSSTILTSATLMLNKNFRFFAGRCGTSLVSKDKIKNYYFKSSFDYTKQVQFFVPKGIAYSNGKDNHFRQSAEFLEQAVLASGGGSLILCSGHEQVKKLYDRLLETLSRNNVWLLRQQKGSSVSSVIRDFKKDLHSVLIGTKSLWQGIDIPGPSLRSLFIYKIPYDVPSRPLIRARCEEIRERGGDDFAEYYEPIAALALKQGFGRLIRKSTDVGIAVLLDQDLMKKRRILNSFPEGVEPKLVEPEVIYEALRQLNALEKNNSQDTEISPDIIP